VKFTLHYRGKLPSNGSREEKHALREHFHIQLTELWSHPPLADIFSHVFPTPSLSSTSAFPIVVGPFSFAPLVSSLFWATAELEVVILRPEPPGRLITQGGDIDNRLKTLFDALSIPQTNQLPTGVLPTPDQSPLFHCLLHDDNLITAVSVKTAQLLEPTAVKNDVELLVNVRTEVKLWTFGNTHLG